MRQCTLFAPYSVYLGPNRANRRHAPCGASGAVCTISNTQIILFLLIDCLLFGKIAVPLPASVAGSALGGRWAPIRIDWAIIIIFVPKNHMHTTHRSRRFSSVTALAHC